MKGESCGHPRAAQVTAVGWAARLGRRRRRRGSGVGVGSGGGGSASEAVGGGRRVRWRRRSGVGGGSGGRRRHPASVAASGGRRRRGGDPAGAAGGGVGGERAGDPGRAAFTRLNLSVSAAARRRPATLTRCYRGPARHRRSRRRSWTSRSPASPPPRRWPRRSRPPRRGCARGANRRCSSVARSRPGRALAQRSRSSPGTPASSSFARTRSSFKAASRTSNFSAMMVSSGRASARIMNSENPPPEPPAR